MAAVPSPRAPPSGVIFVVEERANPSTDYFVLPLCAATGATVRRCDFTQLPAAEELAGVLVVLVRYVPPAWRTLLSTTRSQLGGLAFFMDDDVLDEQASVGMPWRYRYKLAKLATRHRSWLVRQKVQLWVSTPWLMQKYASWGPQLVLPHALPPLTDVCRLFYHGGATHEAEVRWLLPVVEEVLQRDQRLMFELVGGPEIYRLYRHLERVTVLHPMKWQAYQALLAMPGRHIGLAPLLDIPFNRARSCTKFFDITRCGAVGIYSSGGACADLVRHEVDGLVLPMDPQAWVDAILQLARNEPLRRRLFQKAQAREVEANPPTAQGFPLP